MKKVRVSMSLEKVNSYEQANPLKDGGAKL